jgi:hypothetical protein
MKKWVILNQKQRQNKLKKSKLSVTIIVMNINQDSCTAYYLLIAHIKVQLFIVNEVGMR